jgi:NAD(P)-dependent dehydrogenase (short-subunit alcohol dehydrogenase family)
MNITSAAQAADTMVLEVLKPIEEYLMAQRTWMVTSATRGNGAEIVSAALETGDCVAATGRDISAVTRACRAVPHRPRAAAGYPVPGGGRDHQHALFSLGHYQR